MLLLWEKGLAQSNHLLEIGGHPFFPVENIAELFSLIFSGYRIALVTSTSCTVRKLSFKIKRKRMPKSKTQKLKLIFFGENFSNGRNFLSQAESVKINYLSLIVCLRL